MASPATFVAYIDEAGDEGFKFGKGSSEWFVLGAAILRRASEMPEIKLIDDVRARLNRGRAADRQYPVRKALHFRDLQHDVRKYYASRIAQANLTTAVVLLKKRDMISGNEPGRDDKRIRSALYPMATIALMQTLWHHCAENYVPGEAGDGSVDLVFSSRSTLNYDDIRRSIGWGWADPMPFEYGKPPGTDIIRPSQVQAVMHSKSMGLQIADAVTSGYFYAVEATADGFTEDGYVRLLLPCAYRQERELFGYGVKFERCLPETLEEMRRELLRWER